MKIKLILLNNISLLLYIFCAAIIEGICVLSVDGSFFIQSPLLSLSLLGITSSIIFAVTSARAKMVLGSVFLIVQSAADLIFVIVYNMTETYFDYGMLNLRNDAFGILENLPMDFICFYTAGILIVFYVIISKRSYKYSIPFKHKKRITACALATAVLFTSVAVLDINNRNSSLNNSFTSRLYENSTGKYSSLGVWGNFVNEMSKGLFYDKTVKMSDDKISDYLYSSVSPETSNFGVSAGNNLVVILCESFEWFSFINDAAKYPNSLGISSEDMEYLFPNITRLYNGSVAMTNFHSREKTDISEALSIIGSYPTDAYVYYDFVENTMPYTLPALIKQEASDASVNYFHNGYASFYNREQIIPALGFDSVTDCYKMYEMSQQAYQSGKTDSLTITDYIDLGQRNLDSEMIETAKDKMFPEDTRFCTYITTITMHGIYAERDNLARWREKINSVYTLDTSDNANDMAEKLYHYTTACMEFDFALGKIFETLEERGLLDNTTIAVYGDHNTYYHGLSNYVKGINDYNTDGKNFTDLYCVPFMIYDTKLTPQTIDKFTCTADIVPTLADLLGIKLYSNMYYGNSVFTEDESVLYSRAYDIFMTDEILLRNFSSVMYPQTNYTSLLDGLKENILALSKKIEYSNQIFYNDFFSERSHLYEFYGRIKELNEK